MAIHPFISSSYRGDEDEVVKKNKKRKEKQSHWEFIANEEKCLQGQKRLFYGVLFGGMQYADISLMDYVSLENKPYFDMMTTATDRPTHPRLPRN